MKYTEDTSSAVHRCNVHQLEPIEDASGALSADYDNSMLEGLTSSDHADLQEDELFEQFSAHISAPNGTVSVFPATCPASFLYPSLQPIGYPTVSYPIGTHELSPPTNMHIGTLHMSSAHSLSFPCMDSHISAFHQSFPISQSVPFQVHGGELCFPFACQQHPLSPILPDPNTQAQELTPFLTNMPTRPESMHSEDSASHSQSLQLPHVYLHSGMSSFTPHIPPFSSSFPIPPSEEYHHGAAYPPIIHFPPQTQTNRTLSLGKGKTVLFCSKPSYDDVNLPIMSPSELSSYVLGLLDSDASAGNLVLENLRATLNVTSIAHFENFYINLYNATIENLLALAKSHRGSLFIVEFIKKIDNTDLYSNLLSSLLDNTKSLMSNQHSIGLLQSLLDYLPDKQFLYFCNCIELDCMTYCYHRQGNHVIQKVISLLEKKAFVSEEYREVADKISAAILKKPSDFLALSDQVCGCRIYQKLFPLIVDEKELDNIRSVLVEKFVSLCNNQWANFCVQGFIQNKRLIHTSIRNDVIKQLIKNSMTLCTHKFGSHVVEKFLECCTVKERIDFSMSLFMNSSFPCLMDDSYGNFIVQKMLQQKENRNDARLTTLRETCGRLCKHYLKKHGFREQSVKHITGYLNKSLKKIKSLEPLLPEKVLDIARELDTSSWIFNV